MANIAVRSEKQLAPVLGVPEPVQMLRDLLRWNPFREIVPNIPAEVMNFIPAFDVRETVDRFVFIADVPGLKENEVEITLAGNRLMITGARKIEKIDENETYFTSERGYGTFNRVFTLPEGADFDHIIADLKDGVLTVVVPKLPEMKAKKIAIKGGAKA